VHSTNEHGGAHTATAGTKDPTAACVAGCLERAQPPCLSARVRRTTTCTAVPVRKSSREKKVARKRMVATMMDAAMGREFHSTHVGVMMRHAMSAATYHSTPLGRSRSCTTCAPPIRNGLSVVLVECAWFHTLLALKTADTQTRVTLAAGSNPNQEGV
jgi:hypothetical protein